MATLRTLVVAACATLSASPLSLAADVTTHLQFLKCANQASGFSQPVGLSAGNAKTVDSKLKFFLLDPSKENNAWLGSANEKIDIHVSIKAPTEIDVLLNTFYGQNAIKNATVVLKGSGGFHKSFTFLGNKTIRDFNNWVWTNTINGTTAEEWWTNNLSPQPQDQSKRMDAHVLPLGAIFAGKTLTDFIVVAPPNAGEDNMQPVFWGANVIGPSANEGPITCSTAD